MSILLAILGLALLIVVHEGGHYFVARWCKMRVERFSVGFGPALVKWQRGETQFQISAVPFGGFVQITGMNPQEQYDEKDPHVYPNRPTWQRIATIAAGPTINILFSAVLIFFALTLAGVATGRGTVAKVVPASPAQGQLLPGDVIESIDGAPVARGGISERVNAAKGEPVKFGVVRDGKPVEVTVAPRRNLAMAFADKLSLLVHGPWSELGRERGWEAGIQIGAEKSPAPVGTALVSSVEYPWSMSGRILGALWDVVRGKEPLDTKGPVGITAVISDHFEAGWGSGVELLALLSVYLGLFNLLPLPALDGGRLAFLGYELATRRRPNPRFETAVHTVGFLLLFGILILVTFKDITQLF